MADVCEICKNESRIIALERDGNRNSDQHREFYDAIKENAVNQAVTDSNYAQILAVLAELKSNMDEVKSNPAKRWEKLVLAVITAVAGYVVAVILGA